MTDHPSEPDLKTQLLEAVLLHVPFDGWSDTSFAAAVRELNIDMALARSLCPRGAVDLAVVYHRNGDAAMLEKLADCDLSEMRFRDRIAAGVRFRLEAVSDKEAVRRGSILFALPQHAVEGAKLVWETVDHIWTALGDSSDDVNWYSKRITLSGVYGATVLFWLGDDSLDHVDSWAFLDRRIEDVMQFEKLKAKLRENPLFRPLVSGLDRAFAHVKAPKSGPLPDVPGYWQAPSKEQPQDKT